MAMRFLCPQCKRELSGPESTVGSEVQCPSCQTVFLATDPRSAAAMRIAAQNPAPAAKPRVEVRNPFRQSEADDDYPRPRSQAPKKRSGYSFGLIALLVLAPLSFFGIVTWILLGTGPSPTTAPARFVTVPPTMMKVKKELAPDWQTFKIPNTTSTVSLPGPPVAEPEKMVGDAVVNRYRWVEADEGFYEIAMIHIPPVQIRDSLLADWIREQLISKLDIERKDLIDSNGAIPPAAHALRWGKDRNVIQSYLYTDNKLSILYVFRFSGWDPTEAFFKSIHIGEPVAEEKKGAGSVTVPGGIFPPGTDAPSSPSDSITSAQVSCRRPR